MWLMAILLGNMDTEYFHAHKWKGLLDRAGIASEQGLVLSEGSVSVDYYDLVTLVK